MPQSFYSGYINPELIARASMKLLEGNAYHLLEFLYDDENRKSIFGHPEVRIGLSIKILHKLIPPIDESVLRPIIRDIEDLMSNEEYLKSTGNPKTRYDCLEEELEFVHKYLDFEDTITLNTERPSMKKREKQVKNVKQEYEPIDDQETLCLIQ